MNYCPYCGTANRDGSRFCNECGRKMPSKTGIVCPMCSHINPTTNIYCDSCQARLVPAASPASEESEAPQSATPIKKAISLPTKSPAEFESETELSEVDETSDADETPDWLQNLRKAVPKASERRAGSGRLASAKEGSQESDEDLPDWMRTDAPEDQDWFQRISSVMSPSPHVPTASPTEEEELPDGVAEAGDVPDWLSRMRSEPTAVEPEAETFPDWLSEPEADTTASTPDTPDWLSGLRSAAPVEESVDETQEVEEEELPDWLSGFAGGVQVESRDEAPAAAYEVEDVDDELPDWMSAMSGAAQTEAKVATPEVQAADDDTPDWLAGLRAVAPATPDVEAIEEDEDTDSLDWLKELPGLEPDISEPVAETPSAEDVPDWLKDFSSARAPATQVEEEASAVANADETDEAPDWLKDFSSVGSTATQVEAEPLDDGEEIEAGEVPDWLQALRSEAPVSETRESAPTAFVDVEEDLLESETTPDWLSAAQQDAAMSEAEPLPAAEPAEVPAWLRDLGPVPRGAQSETPFGDASPAEAADIPQWLRGVKPGAPASPFQAAEEEAADASGLATAPIPSWLEALRPAPQAEIDAEVVEDEHVETEGLLAGLRSVLPSSPLMAQAVDRPAATRMQMSGVDAARAGLFQELLSRGSVAPLTLIRPGLGTRARARDWVTRLIILVLFVTLIAIPTGEGGAFTKTLFQLSQLGDRPYAGVKQVIDALPDGARVLVAFDYDASQAGEMDEVARALLTHLQQRGAQMDVVGLNPASPVLAERITQQVPDLSFTSVSYLPGEAAGAQSALSAASHELLVVLAGSPETMRVWIEQTALAAPQMPLLAGLSAGAWSQVQPYVRSGQVRAEMTGAMAALAYQRILDPESDAGDNATQREIYSEALFLTQVAFAVLLVVGGVVSFVIQPRRAN